MAGKPTPRKWTDIQLAIATVSMTAVLAYWNMFAGPDKEKAAAKAAAEEQAKVIPTPTEVPLVVVTPEPTMPPQGYKILFGGEAPRPQQIIIQKSKGGGGGGDEGGGGGGGGGPVTSTGSS